MAGMAALQSDRFMPDILCSTSKAVMAITEKQDGATDAYV
jgi:hypothetical protein